MKYFILLFLMCTFQVRNETRTSLNLIMLDGVRLSEFKNNFIMIKPEMDIILGNNEECTVSNPSNISLPAYSDILAANRQNVNNNWMKGTLRYPTIIDSYYNDIFMVTFWNRIGDIYSKNKVPFPGKIIEPNKYIPGKLYDSEIHKEALKNRKKLNIIIYSDIDTAAHYSSWNLYIQKINNSEQYITELMNKRPNDIFIIATDHSRSNNRWKDHGTPWPESKYIWVMIKSKKEHFWMFYNLTKNCNHIELGKVLFKFMSQNFSIINRSK